MKLWVVLIIIFIGIFLTVDKIADENDFRAHQSQILIQRIYTPEMEKFKETLREYRKQSKIYKFFYLPPTDFPLDKEEELNMDFKHLQ
jgi:hypothetical protein